MRALWLGALLWAPALVLAVTTWVYAPKFLFGLFMLPGLIAVAVAQRSIRRARAMAPSDLEVSAEGLTIKGGPRDGMSMQFSSLERALLRPATGSIPQLLSPQLMGEDGEDAEDLHVLFLVTKDSRLRRIAMTKAPAELASLEELAATLQAIVQPLPVPENVPLPQQVLRCPSCTGPVAPSAEAEVACGWCNQRLEVPEVLRERVRAAQSVSAHSFDAVKKVLDQPPAKELGWRFKVLTRVLMAAWWAGLVALVVSQVQGRPFGDAVSAMTIFVFGIVTGGFALFRYLLVDRQAMRVLTMQFAALGSEKEGAPRSCRHCRGPLVSTADQLVVTCVFCDAPNLMGADLRHRAAAVTEESRSLSDVLARRSARRTTWGAVAGAGFVLLLVGFGALGWMVLA